MTDSSASHPRPKLVFIHGLNNNPECFGPLMDYFRKLGVSVDFVVLPGHGANRLEAPTLERGLDVFAERMERFRGVPFRAVCFSHGALYLQLWLARGAGFAPERQALLAPALYIKRQRLICALLALLPGPFLVKSRSPRAFRRYEFLSAREYDVLVRGMRRYQASAGNFSLPTLTMIDPLDELVDAQTLKAHFPETVFVERRRLRGLGSHHILFHPDYFTSEEWAAFTAQLEDFLLK